MSKPDAPAVESVDRALRLLQELGAQGSGATLEELSVTTGLPKARSIGRWRRSADAGS